VLPEWYEEPEFQRIVVVEGANALVDGLSGATQWAAKLGDKFGEPWRVPKLNPTEAEPITREMDYRGFAKALDEYSDVNRKVPQTANHFHAGAIQIHVNGNSDPTRVAKKTVAVMMDLALHPKTASLTGYRAMTR
jgi:hypothetical protein